MRRVKFLKSVGTATVALDDLDDEEFCDDCFAGMESSEHFEKCERPAREAAES